MWVLAFFMPFLAAQQPQTRGLQVEWSRNHMKFNHIGVLLIPVRLWLRFQTLLCCGRHVLEGEPTFVRGGAINLASSQAASAGISAETGLLPYLVRDA